MHKVAIIGAGLMGHWHLATARGLGAQVIAVVDPDIDAAKRLAARSPGTHATDDLGAVLAHGEVRVAHICSPLKTHREIASRLIESGVHIFVEKPFTETAAEAQDLLQRASLAKVLLCPVHQYAFQSAMDRAILLLPGLGPLRRLDMNICSAGAEGAPTRRNEIVADILPHPISILQRLRPDLIVDELSWTTHSSGPGELMATSRAEELLITLFISLNTRPACFEIKLQTELGGLELDGFHGFGIKRPGTLSRPAKIAAPFARSVRILVAASANLAGRALRNETAYPGLSALTRRFYESVSGDDPRLKPIPDEAILAAARLRDLLAARLEQMG